MSEPSLDDVLSGEEVVLEEETVEEESPVEEPEPTKGEEESEPPSDEPESKETKEVPITALLDERDKRQKLERELEGLKKQAQKEPEKRIDPVDDPEGFQDQVEQAIKAATFQQDLKWMRRTHDDWEEAEAWINEQLGDNVALQAKLQNSESILDDAYAMFQQHKKLEALEDVEAMEARIRAEVEAKVRAELEQSKAAEEKVSQTADKAVSKPSVASQATSTSSAAEGEFTLEDLLGGDALSRPR